MPLRPDESELLKRVSAADPDFRMPPKGPALTADEIAKLRRWIAEGAPWPVHWAYRPLTEPAVPRVAPGTHERWPRTPIDRFILHELLDHGLAPSPPADKPTLLRRVSFDLIGLPPTPEEVDAFLADDSPDAYERAVDRLLASPHYGERWARHWMDVVHYAETHGHDQDRPRDQRLAVPRLPDPLASTTTSPTPASSRSKSPATCSIRTTRGRSSRPASWPPGRGTRARCVTSARTRSTGRSAATSTATTW